MSSNQKPNNNSDHRILPITAKQVSDMVFVMEKLTLQQRRDLIESARQMNINNRNNQEDGEVKYLGKKKYNKEFRKGTRRQPPTNNNRNNNNQNRNNSNQNRNNNQNNRNNQNRSRNNSKTEEKLRQPPSPPHSPPPSDDEDDGELPSADQICSPKPKIGGLKFKKRTLTPTPEPTLEKPKLNLTL